MNKSILVLLFSILFAFPIFGQVCLTFNSFTFQSNNGNGTCTYNITVTVDSGNGAAGIATFSIGGTTVYEATNCICNPTTFTFPVTVACNSTIVIDVFYNAPGVGNDCSGTTGNIVLPVTWFDVYADNIENNILLQWATLSEVNNNYFIIERSSDALLWAQLSDKIKSLGNSFNKQNYQYYDESPLSDINYYRIKQVDFDGIQSYSKIVSSTFDFQKGDIFPNPFLDFLTIKIKNLKSWVITDNQGRIVKMGNSSQINTSILNDGVYIIKAVGEKEVITKQIVKSN